MTRRRHGLYAVAENGPAARSLAADAHRCIMVQAHPRPTEYKCVGLQPNGALPRIVNPARTHPSLPLTSPTMRLDNSCPIQACPWLEQGARRGMPARYR